MKALFRFLVFLVTGRLLDEAGQNKVQGGDVSRQYEQIITRAETVEPQLRAIYLRDPLVVHWDSLTRRQQDVVALICLGQRNPEIANILGITTGTVKGYVEDILRKLHVQSRTEIRMMYRDWDFQTWWMNRQIQVNETDHAHK